MLHFAEATKDYLVHRGLTTHDIEKHPYKAIRTCLLFSREVGNIEWSILVLFSDEGRPRWPPTCSKTIPRRKERFYGSLPQLARLAGSFLRNRNDRSSSFTGREDSRSFSTCCRAPRPCLANYAPSGWCWSDCRGTS